MVRDRFAAAKGALPREVRNIMSADGTPAPAPVRSDDEIRNSVLMELKWDPKITSPDIGVALKDGVVTLTGFAQLLGKGRR